MSASEMLPTAAQAMAAAVRLCSEARDALDLDQARTWVLIAAELRAGARPKAAELTVLPAAESFDFQIVRHENCLAGAGETATFPRVEDTQVMEPELPRCFHCGHSLFWVTPGPADAGKREPHWAHQLTMQSVCPVSAPDRPHTYATPRGDARG